MVNIIPPDLKRFKVSIVSLLLCGFITCCFGIVVGYLAILVHDGHVDVHRFLYTLRLSIFQILLCGVIVTFLLYVAIISVGLSVDGMYGSSVWGLRRFIHWADIAKVRKFQFLNLNHLRIYSKADGKVTWLILNQANKKKFQDEIRKFAPPDSPILNFLN
jgi:hypothetical protein